MTSVLIGVAAKYDGKDLKEVAASAVDRDGGVLIGEKTWGIEGGLHQVFKEIDDWCGQWDGKMGFVADGASMKLFKKDIPAMVKKHKTVSVAASWYKFHDLTREVERTYGDKCSGLLGIMMTVGLEPEVTSTPTQEATVIGNCIVKLLKKGNEFKRPLMAKEMPEEEKAKKAEAKKVGKKRKHEEVEKDDEEEASPPPPPPVVPSMAVLRESTFLSHVARSMPASVFNPIADCIKPALLGSDTPAATPQTAPKKKKKAATSSTTTPSKTVKLQQLPTATAEWASVVVAYALAAIPETRPCVVAVPTVSCVIEAAAAFTDCDETDVLAVVGEEQPQPGYSHNVVVTTTALLDEVLKNVKATVPPTVLTVLVKKEGEDGVEAGKYPGVVVEVASGNGVPIPLPEGEDVSLESVVGIEDGEINQKTITSFKRGDFPTAASILHELSESRKSISATFSAAIHYLLSITPTEVEPPAGMCKTLLEFHSKMAWLVMEIDLLTTVDPKQKKQFCAVNEVLKAILRAPLLPYKDPREDPKKKKKMVPGSVILQTVVLSMVSKYLVDSQVDEVAELWGVRGVVSLPSSADMHCVKYGKKVGGYAAEMEGVVVRRLEGEQLGVGMGVLAQECRWTWVQRHFGPFNKYLNRCRHAFAADKRENVVYISSVTGASSETIINPIPLSGRTRAEAAIMASQAIEELLVILPRGTRKALLSSLGVSISGWSRFNLRYNGLLGPSLYGFLIRHPEAFTVSGRTVWRTDPKTSPNYDPKLLKHGGRESVEEDESVRNQKRRKVGSRAQRLHNVISDKFKRKQARKNSLRSAKMQKIPGFGKKKGKYKGKGMKPHYMK
eukprot:TRINITY_DN20872_c0_g1_i1.p1 TRINITY_DN20872_c0_g1~~TRINITY_DN20872_c0_g1_i1.p1  ORF type:complete len:840 (+),score=227.17 TRINITY_DN20872_c0_g1_i1:80-2599(+)